MEILKLTNKYLKDFKEYCSKYSDVHDESYLYTEDIDEFEIGEKNPTVLLIENNNIIGVLSLMMTDYFLKAKKYRVRIFHCESTVEEHYKALLDNIFPLSHEVENIEMFIPRSLTKVQNILKKLDFNYFRTAFLMERVNKPLLKETFPTGYDLKPFRSGKDEAVYKDIRNIAFKNLEGSQTPITEEDVVRLTTDTYLLKDGAQILWHNEKPIGIIRVLYDTYNNKDYGFVAPIAIIPEYQGRGLGLELLKAAIRVGQDSNYNDSLLSVNGENENAIKLYLKAGYEIDREMSCFRRNI